MLTPPERTATGNGDEAAEHSPVAISAELRGLSFSETGHFGREKFQEFPAAEPYFRALREQVTVSNSSTLKELTNDADLFCVQLSTLEEET